MFTSEAARPLPNPWGATVVQMSYKCHIIKPGAANYYWQCTLNAFKLAAPILQINIEKYGPEKK